MTTLAAVVLIIYALLMLLGGIVGYRAAGSRPSLFSGIISAILLFVALGWTRVSPRGGFLSAALIALVLAIVFVFRLRRTRAFLPSGLLLLVSLIALGIFLAAGLLAPGSYPAV